MGGELFLGDIEEGGEFLDILRRGSGLTVEECCNGYFRAVEGFANGFKRKGFGGFTVEENLGDGREAVDECGLCFERLLAVFVINWCVVKVFTDGMRGDGGVRNGYLRRGLRVFVPL